MTTAGPVDTAVRSVRLHTRSRTEQPGVAERDVRRLLLACRLLGDIGALLLGLMVAQGIQQALMVVRSSVEPVGPVAVFNTLAILIWLGLFASAGLYDSRRLVNATEEFKLILQAVATGTVAATFAAFALRSPPSVLGCLPPGSAARSPCWLPVSVTGCILRTMRQLRRAGQSDADRRRGP